MKRIPERILNSIGNKYHKITIQAVELIEGKIKAIYKCDCGRTSKCDFYHLSTKCKSCSVEDLKPKIIHGHTIRLGSESIRVKSPEYNTWKAMKARCHNPNNQAYHNYGGRGIYISERWLGPNGFINFYHDMGEKPLPKKEYSIDRINNNLGYCPENCRWATVKEQLQNKRPKKNGYTISRYDKECLMCKKIYHGIQKSKYCSSLCNGRSFKEKIKLKKEQSHQPTKL